MIPDKINVEIWSDITCVHCFIAKKKFEAALSQFMYRDQVRIIWRSFEIAPGLAVKAGQSMYEFLAEYNGATIDQVKTICNHIAEEGRKVGITFNFDTAVPANSFLAHQFVHLAMEYQLQNEAKEALYKAHFTDGLDIASIEVLKLLGKSIGMDSNVVNKLMSSSQYSDAVNGDIEAARKKGITAVPYYVINSAHAIRGTKDSSAFLELLEESYQALTIQGANKIAGIGDACEIGKAC